MSGNPYRTWFARPNPAQGRTTPQLKAEEADRQQRRAKARAELKIIAAKIRERMDGVQAR